MRHILPHDRDHCFEDISVPLLLHPAALMLTYGASDTVETHSSQHPWYRYLG